MKSAKHMKLITIENQNRLVDEFFDAHIEGWNAVIAKCATEGKMAALFSYTNEELKYAAVLLDGLKHRLGPAGYTIAGTSSTYQIIWL